MIVGILFLLVGCGRILPGDKDVYVDYKTGTKGIKIEEVNNLPPKEIYEKDNFIIGVKVQNEGAYDITKGEIFIAGLDEQYNKLERKSVVLRPLKGRSLVYPEGESYIEEFKGGNVMLPPDSVEYRSKYIIYVNYDYETVLDLDVCINPNLHDLKLSKDACKVDDSVSLSGQGAPVAITKVDEIISPEGDMTKVQFRLSVANKGGGKLTAPVRVVEVKLANRRLTCTPRIIDLRDADKKEKIIVCEGLEPLQAPYITKLSAHLKYNYETEEIKDFTIKKLQFN